MQTTIRAGLVRRHPGFELPRLLLHRLQLGAYA